MASSTTPSSPDDVYINIVEAPGALLSLDALNQTKTLIHQLGIDEGDNELKKEADRFLTAPALRRTLENMQSIYVRGQCMQALLLLQGWVKVAWKESHMVLWPRDLGNRLNWSLSKHFLDMLVVIS